ncbi:DUF4304 domain-containing protein [Mycolicibacterium sediminis]|uniref:DUF4304 domain-containing protein n=1 Tax=Mycolicibacterium sediminis TaxID=1286180 RepID=A0A7I7QN17_9MYCO|nr:DUF4304 domain-containing protein [Mycolicibacterium sediminis]BBY27694.1 hypothetical protein MSEDJ_17900 [Mycolicibacterium sediminis]
MGRIAANDKPSPLQREFDFVLSQGVEPFLRGLGFMRDGLEFRRDRGDLYDVVGFQENWHNGVTRSHGSFINVGVGSRQVDAAWKGPRSVPLLDRRWESIVPDLPYEVRFDRNTDLIDFAAALCDGLEEVIAVIEEYASTTALVQYAVTYNYLHHYEETCCYLAAIADVDTLAGYVGVLRDRFGHQDRWVNFNRRISEVTGKHTATLLGLGLLDPLVA